MRIFPILSCLFLTLSLSAQDLINVQNGCSFNNTNVEAVEGEYYVFDASNEASRIVKEILDGAGALSYHSFVLKESGVKNAMATTVNKKRFILYSLPFLERFKGDAKTKWASYTVLAHEIGHHLNGHDFEEKDPKLRRKMELEADRFAGAVCRTLHATLEQALAGIESMELEGETATHPEKKDRAAAVANGWQKQDDLLRDVDNDQEMETAIGNFSGKIYQKLEGVEFVLYSAKREIIDFGNYSGGQHEYTIFHFLVQNTTDTVITFAVNRDYNSVTKTSVVVLGVYDQVERIECQDYSIGLGNSDSNSSGNSVSQKVADQASSYFKVIFKDLQPMNIVPELRVSTQIFLGKNVKQKTLSFKNIPLPYEMK